MWASAPTIFDVISVGDDAHIVPFFREGMETIPYDVFDVISVGDDAHIVPFFLFTDCIYRMGCSLLILPHHVYI